MTTRLGATPKGAADKANFPLAPILGPQFMLCVVSQSLLMYHGVSSKAAIQTPRHPMFSTQGGRGSGDHIWISPSLSFVSPLTMRMEISNVIVKFWPENGLI